MFTLSFHPLGLQDAKPIRRKVEQTECRNCDLNFMNLYGWRFLYDTEVAYFGDWLIFRFKAHGHLAYLAPVGPAGWQEPLEAMQRDAAGSGHPFLLLGVCERDVQSLEVTLPDYFYAHADRDHADYVYAREALAELRGKKLQAKRNHANRFARNFPDYALSALRPSDFPDCGALYERWADQKDEAAGVRKYEEEHRAFERVLSAWDELEGEGLALRVGGKLVAFTYGAPVNYDTFDVCMEKADTAYEGAYAFINRAMAASLPPRFRWINREEDLGVPGLRAAKLSYHPEQLLQKYTVLTKHPLGGQ